MKTFKIILIFLGILIIIMVTLNGINILQAGSKEPDGRTMAQILGVDPQTATYDDMEKLSRKEKMQLFYAAKTPDFKTLNGEYEARLLSGGILGKSSALFTHYVFPTGLLTLNTQWVGKAFSGNKADAGRGYNIFTENNSGGNASTLRIRPMKTSMGVSKLGKDGKLSFLVDYSSDNTGTIHSMRDEIRQINDNLFIGAGYMGLGGGPINPAPFALIGPPKPWVGPDS
ncbi:MAG: hypothetical protein HF978_17085 [Desulfobacteraceae bacterium]|nr:hypothetical protein [Desulfobacteraceae bacterium]MBC2757260.1 hypothetical protein [Desulfobacteraceae bacterium]